MGAWLRKFGTTATAVFLGGLLSIAFAIAGAQLFLDGLDPERIDRQTRSTAVRLGMPSGLREMGVISTISGIVILLFVLVASVALIGVAMRRQGFREAALGVFSAFAIVMIPLGISGQAADPPAENAMVGVLVGVVSALVVISLAVPATSLTFDRAELDRRRRQSGKS